MTKSDILGQAARALREAHTGEREGSGFTRARIMVALHRERRRRLFRWVVLSPLASLLVVGSAWAQSTGQWPVVWRAVASVLAFTGVERPRPPTPGPAPRAVPERSSPAPLHQAAEAPSLAPAGPETPPAASDVAPVTAPPELATAPQTAPTVPRSAHARRPPRVAPRASQAAPPATVGEAPAQPESKPDADLALFRLAHDLHVAGRQSRAAIAAYDDYLAAFPNGRFVPEARYNRALDSIKLGDKAGARAALEAFARGAYGDYRRKEARDLLEALH
jgi:hypothetical protein